MNQRKKIFKKIALAALAAFVPALPSLADVEINGHPESVAEDDNIFYVACIGQKLTPTEKDGDGFIVTVDDDGDIISPNAFPQVRLDAPKGAEIEDGVLYVADVDRVVGINIRLGTVVFTVDFSREGTKYLNDIVEDDDFLYVSATDIGKIFRVSLRDGSYEELKTAEPLDSPNGLAIEDDVLYVAEFAKAHGAPAGKIKAIPLRGVGPRPVFVIYNVSGLYDGLEIEDEEDLFGNETDWLYFSDWAENGKAGAVRKLNLRTREVKDVMTGFTGVVPANGPADFIVEDGKIWLPAMVDKKVIIH